MHRNGDGLPILGRTGLSGSYDRSDRRQPSFKIEPRNMMMLSRQFAEPSGWLAYPSRRMQIKLVTTRLKRPCETRDGPTEVHGGRYPGTGLNARFEIGSTIYCPPQTDPSRGGPNGRPPVDQWSQYAGTKGQYQPVTARLDRIGNPRRPCSGTVFDDQPVERPHIRRPRGVATSLRHLVDVGLVPKVGHQSIFAKLSQ